MRAGVRRFQLVGQVRPWNSHTVISPRINHHIGALRHVAVYAETAGFFRVMKMMRPGSEFCRRMTTVAQRIALSIGFAAVRFMAVGAHDARLEHFALQEGAIDVHFILDLAVGEIEALLQHAGLMRIEQ